MASYFKCFENFLVLSWSVLSQHFLEFYTLHTTLVNIFQLELCDKKFVMISTFGIIVIVAVFIIEIIINYRKAMQDVWKSLCLAIRFKFSVMFNGVNLQRGNVFILIFVIYTAIEIIVIMSSIIKILEILLLHSPMYFQSSDPTLQELALVSTSIFWFLNASGQW